jgi:hypothetical protein
MSICDPAAQVFGSKPSVYELEDNLEDETLRLIMNPQEHEIQKESERINSNLESEKDKK